MALMSFYSADSGTPPSLLVRRAGRDPIEWAEAVLGSGAASRADLEDCAAAGGLFVLAEVAWEPSETPLAAAALQIDREGRRARLMVLDVAERDRYQDLGRRLLEGVGMLLRADGIEAVEASADPALTSLLRSFGFRETERRHLLYLL